jgi:DNA polymerase III delta prime subunit
MRFFTTEGPVNCAKHYCLPPLERFSLDEIVALIAQEKYFLLHAPRQTGKTSCLLALAEYLNRQGDYHAVYANIEAAQALREDVAQAMATVVTYIATSAATLTGDSIAVPLMQEVLETNAPGAVLGVFLTHWCQLLDKPLVLFLDEVDALVGDTLISLLRQLRAGYPTRPHAFPQSLILCGVRDLNSAVPTGRGGHNPSSPIGTHDYRAFNIKAESLRLGDFVQPEVETLLLEHTHETGQVFTPDALERVWELTQGQPWLVNALAYETTWEMKEGRDRSQPITAERVREAKEALILRRVTHLDQLADKLREPRVRRVVEPMLRGVEMGDAATLDDVLCLPRSRPTVADAGILAAHHQRRRARGSRVRAGTPPHRPVRALEPSRRRAARRDRTQAAAPFAGTHAGGRAGTDLALRRHQRRRGGAPHHLRPHARQSLGRENLAAHGILQRQADHGVGDVER